MNATPKRPYKMIGKDGDAFVVCQPDKHGKNRTIAHVYDADPAYQIVRAVNSFDAMREALETLCKQARTVMQYTNEYDGQLIQAIANGEAALALANGSRER